MADKTKKKSSVNKNIFTSGFSFSKVNAVMLILFLVVEALYYYICTPSLSIYSGELYQWLIVTIILLTACFLNFKKKENVIIVDGVKLVNKITKYGLILIAGVIIILILASFFSSKIFFSSKYAGLINIENGDFATDIAESTDINDIALMDTETAKIIGERAIGSLSDVVSQYVVSNDYSTIDYNGRPMKVASLEYAGFIKYLNNKSNGIPGYVLVDPVKNEAKYVKLDKPMKYVPSAYFNSNLIRHVQMKYPTKLIDNYYLELDNDGNPYYICPTMKANAGLFGAMDVDGVIVCDPCTGDTEYYSVGNVPNWIDRVYDGDLMCRKYDWYGKLSGGYINSIIGNKGCKKTTDDYGYKVMDGDVWVYTGVTSVNADESNIGFVLMNLRTGESKYYSIAGAEEYSAMSSAEGQVQNLGYRASFPSLINIKNIPTYIMVLKDNAGLVKMYALVNVEKYNIVATGNTQRDALKEYTRLLYENGITNSSSDLEDMPNKDIVVKDIKYIAVENETYVYITDNNGDVYKQKFADNEQLIFIQPGDRIKVYYTESEDNINILSDFEKLN